jgi:3-phytase
MAKATTEAEVQTGERSRDLSRRKAGAGAHNGRAAILFVVLLGGVALVSLIAGFLLSELRQGGAGYTPVNETPVINYPELTAEAIDHVGQEPAPEPVECPVSGLDQGEGPEALPWPDSDDGEPVAGSEDLETRVVSAVVRTRPRGPKHDLDEPVLWVNATNPAHSMVITTNKAYGDLELAGLQTYTLSGTPIQTITGFYSNNVDIRPCFSLGGEWIDLIAASDRTEGRERLLFFTVDDDHESETYRLLTDISGSNLGIDYEPYGQALYHDHRTDRWYVFLTQRNEPYHILQYEVTEGTGVDEGKIVLADEEPVRVIDYRPSSDGLGNDPLTLSEGMRVDEYFNVLYVAEEEFGLLRYGAAPGAGTAGVVVDHVIAEGGRIVPDAEGVTIIPTGLQSGYIVVAGQNNRDQSRYEVYDRETNRYLHSIVVEPDLAVDGMVGANGTDGIFGYHGYVNEMFPFGVFIVHSDNGPDELPSLLLVRFDEIWPEDVDGEFHESRTRSR